MWPARNQLLICLAVMVALGYNLVRAEFSDAESNSVVGQHLQKALQCAHSNSVDDFHEVMRTLDPALQSSIAAAAQREFPTLALDSLGQGSTKLNLTSARLESLAVESPEKALLEVEDLPSTEKQAGFLLVYRAWAAVDAKAALKNIKETARMFDKSAVEQIALVHLIHQDRNAYAQAGVKVNWGSVMGSTGLSATRLLEGLQHQGLDSVEALRWLRKHTTGDPPCAGMLALELFQSDQQLLNAPASDDTKAWQLRGAFEFLKRSEFQLDNAGVELQAIAGRLGLNERDSDFRRILQGIAFRIAPDLDSAATAQQIQESMRKQGLSDQSARLMAEAIIGVKVSEDPASLEKFQGAFDEAAMQKLVSSAIGAETATPSVALDLFRRYGKESENAATALVAASNQDPEYFLSQMSPGVEGNDILRQRIFEQWVQTDPWNSSDFVNRMPTGPARDAAITSLVKATAGYDLSAAVAWAASVSAIDVRQKLLKEVGAGIGTDKLREAILANPDVTPEKVNELLENAGIAP